jgi:hypothetical protein
MPRIRKLSAAESAALSQPRLGRRAQLAQTYDSYMSDFAVGEYGHLELAPGEQRAAERRRLQTAARRCGMALRFRPGQSGANLSRHSAVAARPASAAATRAWGGDAVGAGGPRRTATAPATPDDQRALLDSTAMLDARQGIQRRTGAGEGAQAVGVSVSSPLQTTPGYLLRENATWYKWFSYRTRPVLPYHRSALSIS